MKQSRMPKIGDLLFVSWDGSGFDHSSVGLVRQIVKDDYGHQRNVFVDWSTPPPPPEMVIAGYKEKHGYAGSNIHNSRRHFKVIRNGREIA